MSPEKLWKRAERRICELLGGTRRGPTGRDDSDCYHEWLAVEVKAMEFVPRYIHKWMEQSEANAEEGKLPLVVWHKKGARYDDALVFVRLSDFIEWFGDGGLPFTDEPEGCNHSAHNWNRQEDGTWQCRGCGERMSDDVEGRLDKSVDATRRRLLRNVPIEQTRQMYERMKREQERT